MLVKKNLNEEERKCLIPRIVRYPHHEPGSGVSPYRVEVTRKKCTRQGKAVEYPDRTVFPACPGKQEHDRMRRNGKEPSRSTKDIPQKWQVQNLSSCPLQIDRKKFLSSLQGNSCLRQVAETKGPALQVSWDTREGKRNPYGCSLRARRFFARCQTTHLCKLEKICRKFSARWFILSSYLCDKKQ